MISKLLLNKSIFISGGTGSFGKNFIKKLLKNNSCKKIVIYSRDELKQFELKEFFNDSRLRFLIGDVRDKDRLNFALRDIDIVIHAAAMKQVPASEYNPTECINTNIIGAQINNNVEKVIGLSTDKAVNPINLYGATKLASDKLFVAANNIVGKHKTIFSVVRYGNVIGSRGSVLPFFKKIVNDRKGYFPITDLSMTRFWYQMKDAIKFVFDSLYLMKGGEIFVPKIPSIKIVDLARSLNPSLKIKIIGIRPGEKIHEVMCPKDEWDKTIEFKNYFIITPSITFGEKKRINYFKSISGNKGKKVKIFFEYSSGLNKKFLSIKEISKLNDISIDWFTVLKNIFLPPVINFYKLY